jgi:multiple sugar transport system permease protein
VVKASAAIEPPPHTVAPSRRRSRRPTRLPLIAAAYLTVLVIAFPYLWILISSFRDPQHFLSLQLSDALPRSLNLASYRLALARAHLVRYMFNSLLVAVSTTALSLAVACPAAYAFARLRFRGRAILSWFTIMNYVVPSILLVVPMFVFLVKLNLNNSYVGLILVHATFTIPFAVWILRDFYLSIPLDLEEAGYVDGASLPRVLQYIILPLSIPGLLAAGVYAFILSWNNFLFALVLMSNDSAFTAPVGIKTYYLTIQMEQSNWAQLMAASSLVSLPSAILFGFFQRYLVSGFLSGASKG